MTVLSAEGLCVRTREGAALLEDVSLAVEAGETVLVCGPSGGGKTLLVKALRGLLDDRTDLEVDGSISRPGDVGVVFQRPATQLVRRIVRRDVAFGLENRGVDPGEIESRIERHAAALGARSLLDRAVADLSGGETTVVALLGSLVTEPDVLLLDEPVATLDHRNTRLVLDAVDRLRRGGTAVVVAEHDVRDLLDRADRALLLHAGRVRARGPPAAVLDDLEAAGVKLPFATSVGLVRRRAGDDVEVPLSDGGTGVGAS